jgi:hypothetical protein
MADKKYLIKAVIIFYCSSFISFNQIYAQQLKKQLSIKKKSHLIFHNQPDTLVCKVIMCSKDTLGKKINIFTYKKEVKKNQVNFKALYSYEILGLNLASFDSKIQVIDQLLKFKWDSSIVCFKPFTYGTNKDTIVSKYYTLQIDALYFINVICFDYLTINYSPCPILYDTVTNEEINYNPTKIKEVFTIYQNWFEKNKKNGFTDYTFPLLNTRFQWKYGFKRSFVLTHLPYTLSKNWSDIAIRKSAPLSEEFHKN